MLEFRYGGREGTRYQLAISDRFVVVRTRGRAPVERTPLSRRARQAIGDARPLVRFPAAGVEVLPVGPKPSFRAAGEEARRALQAESAIRFAGRALCDPRSGAPVVYTENLFVKFRDDRATRACRKLVSSLGLLVRRELPYARNAFFLSAKEGTGRKVFRVAARLLREEAVELCHPELVRARQHRAAFPQQWHLKKTTVAGQVIDAHANVEAAWALTEGQGTTIAVIDDGFDLDHPEFASAGKIVAPRDVTRDTSNPRPGSGDDHGTACAGVAAADGTLGASGVAPRARLLPIRLASGLGSQDEADAFHWAAENGADVISCSWGPADGRWSDPADPLHQHVAPLPDATRLAIDWAVANGRGGKGCVIVWAAGNGNERVDNDGYASYGKVIAVAACNDGGKRSAYSDFGRAIWCAFPSNDSVPAKSTGIWTTDRSDTDGYNDGQTGKGDAAGHFTNSFGGTSSAAPGAAGVAALAIARNPALRSDEVRDVLRRSCDRIDPAGGGYDARGHSIHYGYGRLNARRAVDLARPVEPARPARAGYRLITRAEQDVAIRDHATSSLALVVGDARSIRSVKVAVEIEHTYVGDLVVTLQPPPRTTTGPITLHNRTGGGARNLKKTFDAAAVPALSSLAGKSAAGTWTLTVKDEAADDAGRIVGFAVEIDL